MRVSRPHFGHVRTAPNTLANWMIGVGFVADAETPKAPRREPMARMEWRCPRPCARIHKRSVRQCPVCNAEKAAVKR